MRKQLSKIALAATLGFAMVLTFSCSSDDGGEENGGSGQTVQPTPWNGNDLNLANCTEVYNQAYIVCRQHYYGQECNDITHTEGDFIIASSKVYRCNGLSGVWVPYNSTGTFEKNALMTNDIFSGNDPDPCKSYAISVTGEFASKECGELGGSGTVCIPPRRICN